MNLNLVSHSKTETDLHGYLSAVECSRKQQLDALPARSLDVVVATHRDSVERILTEVKTALARLEAGTYGSCASCGDTIPPARLELRPWAVSCTGCARR